MNSDEDFADNSTDDFAERLAAPTPTPGGGAAAARVGLFATSLVRMVVGISLKKKPDNSADLESINAAAVELGQRFRQLESDDVAAFDAFIAAVRLPRSTDEEKERRRAARQAAAEQATEVPLRMLRAIVDTVQLVEKLNAAAGANGLSAESDLHAAVAFARASFRVAELNVEANLPYLGAAEAEEVEKERRAWREAASAACPAAGAESRPSAARRA